MNAEILTIGDELCRGEIVDSNSSWLAAELWDRSITVRWMSSVRDDRADMARALRDALGRADLVFVSGGLGPTEDDLTVDVIAEVAGVGIRTDPDSVEKMKARFARAGYAITPNNLRQVRVPETARSLGNPAGMAPGFELAVGASTLFAMPGVPRELMAIFTQGIAPRLAELTVGAEHVAKRIRRVFGMGESHIDHALAGLVDGVAGATLHFQVTFPETLVKVVVRGPDRDAAERKVAELDEEIVRRLGHRAYGTGSDSLASVLGQALKARGATVTTAESCTGGMVGALLTDVPGSSAWFPGGFITYANEAKQRDLGVRAETLAAHGAVSEACVREMAEGARARAGATFAVAVSGIAGPDGGTPDKPVGTVHLAVAGPTETRHRKLDYPGSRDQIRRLSAYTAMAMALRALEGE